jgi:7-cyano-7-deazaguanine synthase in queuosine biosynthesis
MEEDKPSINVLVQNKFTKQSEGLFSLEEPLVLSFRGEGRNMHDDLEQIEENLKSKIDPIILDLYKIALVVYVWDLQTPRPESEPREFRVLMSVSNKDKWNNLRTHLEATLRFLTGDTFVFNFVEGKLAEEGFQFQRKSGECVALFSGGLDSLAGVKWMLDHKLKPVLVSHPGMGLISGAQKELVACLGKITGSELTWHQIRATAEPGTGLTEKEHTQFSRSFLYLTLGVMFALKLGIEREFIFENGVLAFNIPLTQSRVYSNTRTAHPHFLLMYQQLLDSLFDHHVTIENPFLAMTKGQVVKLLDAEGFRDLVKTTISCPNITLLKWRGVKISKTRHCGVCFPCIVRRLSVHYANIWSSDASYAEDIVADYSKIPEEGRKLLFEMMDFARQMDKCSSVEDVFNEFPQFFIEGVDPALLFDMTKRHVAQFKDFLAQRAHQSLRQNLGLP